MLASTSRTPARFLYSPWKLKGPPYLEADFQTTSSCRALNSGCKSDCSKAATIVRIRSSPLMCAFPLEPHIRGAASVLAKTGKILQAFPMNDGEVGDDVRLGHPEVHGGANTAVPVRFEGAVMGDAAATGTKVKTDARFAPRTGGPDIGARGTGKLGPVTR